MLFADGRGLLLLVFCNGDVLSFNLFILLAYVHNHYDHRSYAHIYAV